MCRAAEEVLFGKDAVSLSTSKAVSKAGELARWIVMDSKLHPATRDDVVSLNLRPGGYADPTVKVRPLFCKALMGLLSTCEGCVPFEGLCSTC